MNKIISFLLYIVGLALIVVSFNFFSSEETENNVVILNTVVSCIIYSLFYLDALIPMVGFDKEGQSKVASLGIRWFVTGTYAFLAIGLMFAFAYGWKLEAGAQIIIHSILFLLASMGLFSAYASKNKASSADLEMATLKISLNEIKSVSKRLAQSTQLLTTLSPQVKNEILTFDEGMRYISPNNSSEAHTVESSLLEELKTVEHIISTRPEQEEELLTSLNKCKQHYLNRKNIYSN